MRKTRKGVLVVGVTGAIGSGKTEVCRMLGTLGWTVIYADPLARELMESNVSLKEKLQLAFGPDVYKNGTLDRVKLSQMVFSNEQRARQVNKIVHPYVIERLKQMIRDASLGGAAALVVEAALILESGTDRLMNYVVVVDADEQTRIARAMKRYGLSNEDIVRRQRMQMPSRKKVSRADFLIRNDGDLSALRTRVEFLDRVLRAIVARRLDKS